jgi:hypothetical protein
MAYDWVDLDSTNRFHWNIEIRKSHWRKVAKQAFEEVAYWPFQSENGLLCLWIIILGVIKLPEDDLQEMFKAAEEIPDDFIEKLKEREAQYKRSFNRPKFLDYE